MKKTKAIVVTAIAIGVIAFFFAPIIPMNIPNIIVGGYSGTCYGTRPGDSSTTRAYVSLSYSLIPAPHDFRGNWGLVYFANGIPNLYDHAVAYFPPFTSEKGPIICA